MDKLIVTLCIVSIAWGFQIGQNFYPDSAHLRANFTDGSFAVMKHAESNWVLCDDSFCLETSEAMFTKNQVIAQDHHRDLKSLQICNYGCVECSIIDQEWECLCEPGLVLDPDINWVDHCPDQYVTDKAGIWELATHEKWVNVHERTHFPSQFTLRIEANTPAGQLLEAGNLIVADKYIDFEGMRHDFADAQCEEDVCIYTTSIDNYWIHHYINDELVGKVELWPLNKANFNPKILGGQVEDAKLLWGKAHGPINHRPNRRLQSGDETTQCYKTCGSLEVGVGCTEPNNPAACIFCRDDLYLYDIGSTSEITTYQGIFWLCLKSCQSGLETVETPTKQCLRPEYEDFNDIWIWDKFNLPEGEKFAPVNQSVRDILIVGGTLPTQQEADPIPASNRGLYFTGFSSYMTFQNLNLGTDFTLGAWYKPFYFDSVFAIYEPDGEMQMAIGRWVPGDLPTFAWNVHMEREGDVFTYAQNPADANLAWQYPMEDIWFMMSLRINASILPVTDDNGNQELREFTNMRLYYNDNFAGEAPNYPDDYFEDNSQRLHILGKNLNGGYYRGFIANIIFRNKAVATPFPSLNQLPNTTQSPGPVCETCASCPATTEFYECCEVPDAKCSGRGGCNGLVDQVYICPDCCDPGTIRSIEEGLAAANNCEKCGSKCFSCVEPLEYCDYCIFRATQIPDSPDCECWENHFYDEVNNNCCTPFCVSCTTYLMCDECQCGYELADDPGNEDANICVKINCNGGTYVDCVCTCDEVGYEFDGVDTCRQMTCYEGCEVCTNTSGFSGCVQCSAGYIDIAPAGAGYKYCVLECPSCFTDDCQFDPTQATLANYDFNIPLTTYVNSVANNKITLITKTSVPSASPAKNRGIFFDGSSDGCIELSGFTLYHSYSIITWCFSFGGWGTWWQKRGFSISQDNDGVLSAKVLSQEFVDEGAEVNSGMVPRTWNLVSNDFEMVNGDSTDIRFYLGTQLLETDSVSNFGIDSASNIAYLGIEAIDSGFRRWFFGYCYSFGIRQGSDGSSLRATHGANNSIKWTTHFEGYQADDGSIEFCDSSCAAIGCINNRPCRTDCRNDHEWCHLCLDYECLTCTTYENCGNGDCDDDATNSSNVCECIEDYGRPSIDDECMNCYEGCQFCTNTSGFSGCFQCNEGYIDIAPAGVGYTYCVPDCPTNFVGDCEFSSDNSLLASWNFNVPITTYENAANTSGLICNTVSAAPSGSPAKNRGIYFDGNNDAYIRCQNLVLSHSYSLITWCLSFGHRSNNLNGTIFQKVDTTLAQDSSSTMIGQVLSQTPVDTSGFTGTDMVAGNWYLASVDFEMQNGDSTVIRFYVGTTLQDSVSINNFGVDRIINEAYLGIEKTETGFANRWWGYCYTFEIKQGSDGSTLRQNAGEEDSSSFWTAAFNQYEADDGSQATCHSSCDGIGCINERDCRPDCQNGAEWCHLCLDYECQNCQTYDSCENGACDEHALNFSNVCECIQGYGRIDIDEECEECHPTCETCQGAGISECLSCDGVDRVLNGVAPTECICADGKFPNPTHETCTDCDDLCATCTGPNPYDCTECVIGKYTWKTVDSDDATILCLSEVPTGYDLTGSDLTRDTCFHASFDYWPRQDLRIEDDPVIIDGCVGAEPIPVHGRGMYLTGGDCLDLINLNVGTEFTLSIWYNAESFNNLFAIYNTSNDSLFEITALPQSNEIFVRLRNVDGVMYDSRTNGYSAQIENSWNILCVTLIAARNENYSNNAFGTTIKMGLNNISAHEVFFKDAYMEDTIENLHKIGVNASGDHYVGFVAQFTFVNCALDECANFTFFQTDVCPTCSICPVSEEYINCIADCGFDHENDCSSNTCTIDAVCPVTCDVGEYQTTSGQCETCTQGSQSCRIPNNDRVCDDILCQACTFYAVCESCIQFASPDPVDCKCDDNYTLNPIINSCSWDCHPHCENCDGTNAWQCLTCAPGLLQYTINELQDSILCFQECPTGLREQGNSCVRDRKHAYVFELFRCSILDESVNGLNIVGGTQSGPDSEDPEPIYGRGMWYDGSHSSHFSNLNMGQEWTISFWFNADGFGTLFSVASQSETILELRKTEVGGEDIILGNFKSISRDQYDLWSTDMFTLASTTGWQLEGQWNQLSVTLKSHYLNYDPANDISDFTSQIKFYINEYTDSAIEMNMQQDMWAEDDSSNLHIIGRNPEATNWFVGHIGDIIFANYAIETFSSYITTSLSSCPICEQCPSSRDFIECVDSCSHDQSCVSFSCTNDPICPTNCPNGQFMDNNFACQNCNGCTSCNNEVTCNGCEDELCETCSSCYDECDNEQCKTNAVWNEDFQQCECAATFQYDETTYNCCWPHCIICSDPNSCDRCEENYFGTVYPNICNVRCINGTYNSVLHKCDCDEGWSGDACDIRCDGACRTCDQQNPVICFTCFGRLLGDRCDRCPGTLVPPECSGCGSGEYLETGTDNCQACDGRCLECTGPGPGRCKSCQPSYLTLPIEDSEIMLCLTECGTGFLNTAGECQRMVDQMYRFQFWCGPEPGENSGDVSLSATAESQPLYTWRRGYWFSDGTHLKFRNLNLGNEFALGAWYHTDVDIRPLFGDYLPTGVAILEVRMEVNSGNWRYHVHMQGATGNGLHGVSDQPVKVASGDWVYFSFWSGFIYNSDDGTTGTQAQIYENNIQVSPVLYWEAEFIEDKKEYHHQIGKDVNEVYDYKGFVAEFVYFNYLVVDFSAFVVPNSDQFCRTCEFGCPTENTYIPCMVDCELNMCKPLCQNNTRDYDCILNCTETVCKPTCDSELDQVCPWDCPFNQYRSQQNFQCYDCPEHCTTCRTYNTCSLCQDPLCEDCPTCNECDSCIEFAEFAIPPDRGVCYCTYEEDPNFKICCNENCMECGHDPSDCEVCMEQYFNLPFCDKRCYNGVVIDDKCVCNKGWTGEFCDTPCYYTCLTCTVEDPNTCTSCDVTNGDVIDGADRAWQGDKCEECVGNFVWPQCTVCTGNWDGINCDFCKGNYDIAFDCETCVGNYALPECIWCIEGWAGPICNHGCINGSIIESRCVCDQGYYGGEPDGICDTNLCIQGCDLCRRDNVHPSWGECIVCKPNYFNTSYTSAYMVCAPECPSGYSTDGRCIAPQEPGCIFEYSFNRPDKVFNNESGNSSATSKATIEDSAPSGIPAKNRGIHFSANQPACINVNDVVLNHSFTIHTWVYCHDGLAKALFGKTNLVTLGFDDHRAFKAAIREPEEVMEMSGSLTPGHWDYIAFSYEEDDDTTHAVGYLNNIKSGQISFFSRWIIDPFLIRDVQIGCHKNLAGNITQWWHGFIYNFNMCFKVHETQDTRYYHSGCILGCDTHDLNQYIAEDGSVAECDATCANVGCTHRGPCRTEGCESPCCHLCTDFECRSCETYETCDAGECGPIASNQGTVCACDDGYARNMATQACEPCMESCSTCLFTNVCERCAAGYHEYRPDVYTSDASICLSDCPTGTQQHLGTCRFEGCSHIFFPLFWTSELGGVYGGVELRGNTVDRVSPGPIPVYGRGFYIDNLKVISEARQYISLENLDKGPIFSLGIWYKADNFDQLYESYSNSDTARNMIITKETESQIHKLRWLVFTTGNVPITGTIEDLEYPGFILESDWGFFSISLMTEYITEQDEQGKYAFKIHEYYNGQELERHSSLQDLYYADNRDAPNILGFGEYKGFIGDVFYSNCFIEDWSFFVQSNTDCPGCSSCPVDPANVTWKLECEGDEACIGACDDPMNSLCTDHCEVGTRSSYFTGDVAAGHDTCDPCHNECDSCRYQHTCYTCDDTLCAVCGVYSICEQCVGGTKPESYATGCECLDDYNHDTVHQACCFPTCIECYQTGECITCWPGYIGENCEIPCNGNGTGDRFGCACFTGFTGQYCEMPCDDACLTCQQYPESDPMYCTSCEGKKTGTRCDECVSNWQPTECIVCKPQYFGPDCEYLCVNGVVVNNECICYDFYAQSSDSRDPPGTCVKVDCIRGCADCQTCCDFSTCASCEPGYININAGKDLDFAYCLENCPTGFELDAETNECTRPDELLNTLVAAWDFNFPKNNYTNQGYTNEGWQTIEVLLETDEISGVPAKNRGVCMDGVTEGHVKIFPILLNPTFSTSLWFLTKDALNSCTMEHKEGTMKLFLKNGEMETEISNSLVTREVVYRNEFLRLEENLWQNVVFSYEMIDGSKTDAKYYLYDELMKHEIIDDIITDHIERILYLGAEHQGDGTFTNLCNSCVYDAYLYQDTYTPSEMNRVDESEELVFWDVPLDQYVDGNGDAQTCDPTCTSGCVDEVPCSDDFCQWEYCYLCHDRQCYECDTYETCEICWENSHLSEPSCACNEGYGRRNLQEMCAKCDPSCLSCVGGGVYDCTECGDAYNLEGVVAPSRCLCASYAYPDPDESNCSLCIPPCAECTGSGWFDCTACYPNAYLRPDGSCECNIGYYMNPDDRSECLPCHPTCEACDGPSTRDCISCKHGAYLTLQRSCECYVGPTHTFIPNPDARQCEVQCEYNCEHCVDFPWNCSACVDDSRQVDGDCGCPNRSVRITECAQADPCVPIDKCHFSCGTCFGYADPQTCTSCKGNASLRFDDRPTYCDCKFDFHPSWATDNCVPNYYNSCYHLCETCQREDPDFCLTCLPGAELDGHGNCQCKPGWMANDNGTSCQRECNYGCKSCLLADPEICTSCIEGYFLTQWSPLLPSPCVSYADACPENCCHCDVENPFICLACCDGFALIGNECIPVAQCHRTCLTCNVDFNADHCLTCFHGAYIAEPMGHEGYGACECISEQWKPAPDTSNCVPICHESCLDCSDVTAADCTCCWSRFELAGPAPNYCVHRCHPSCLTCNGSSHLHCNTCHEGMEIKDKKEMGYCECSPGYVESSHELYRCVVPAPTDQFHEFSFEDCSYEIESNGVTLTGASFDSHHPRPLPVQHRGAFLNNRTYYKIEGLDFSSNFGYNAWINSHDTGYATVLSINAQNCWNEDTITSFSWRVANRKKVTHSRKNMIELRDWSNQDTTLALMAYDKSYCPKNWSNIGMSVAYDWDSGETSICFYGYEDNEFHIRTILTLHERFAHSTNSIDVIGHRITSKGEASNQFFGFIYYFSFYNYAVEDFSRSVGHCRGCSCGPENDCLSTCWFNEFSYHGKCAECKRGHQTCKSDGITQYCPNP